MTGRTSLPTHEIDQLVPALRPARHRRDTARDRRGDGRDAHRHQTHHRPAPAHRNPSPHTIRKRHHHGQTPIRVRTAAALRAVHHQGHHLRLCPPAGRAAHPAPKPDRLGSLSATNTAAPSTGCRARLAGQAVKGSVRSIATAYLAGDGFLALKPAVQRKRRVEIERFAEKNGHRMLGKMAADDIKAMMAKIRSPHVRRLWRQALSSMCTWAADQAPPLLARNPFAEVGPVALPKSIPHRRWMPEHVAAFRARWPSGTIERRALEALINTMARGCSDVARLEPHAYPRRRPLLHRRQERRGDGRHPDLARARGGDLRRAGNRPAALQEQGRGADLAPTASARCSAAPATQPAFPPTSGRTACDTPEPARRRSGARAC